MNKRTFTVMGHLLHDCPLEALQAEAEAGHWMKAQVERGESTTTDDFVKLYEIEREIMFRRAAA